MKKNKMMRLASGLLVAVLITTSTISGTFAKYVTSDSASDKARVAKFGVTVTAEGSLFDKTYLKTTNTPGKDEADEAKLTVESSNADRLVAPGTKNEEGIVFTVTGTPEVDVKVTVNATFEDGTVITDSNKHLLDVFLAKNTGLPNMTTGNATDTFDNDSIYQPVKFTLVQTKGGAENTLVNGGTIADVAEKLNALTTETITANTDLAGTNGIGTLKLTWAWDFNDVTANNQKDTLLGDIAAGTTLTPDVTLVEGTDYNLNTGIKVEIKVEQID